MTRQQAEATAERKAGACLGRIRLRRTLLEAGLNVKQPTDLDRIWRAGGGW